MKTSTNICNIDNVFPRFNWYRYLWITCAIIPLAILTFNVVVFQNLLPEWFIDNYVILTYASPNGISMFLSNYSHATGIHMLENLMSYIITIASIAVVALIAIPYTNKKTPGMNCRFGTKTLVQSTCIFFLIVPFVISAISSQVGIMLGITGGLGFSGVVFAFEGYLVYIAEVIIIRKLQIIWTRKNKVIVYFGIALIVSLPMAFIIGQIITMYTSPMAHPNYIAHLTGFVIGFMTPFLLERRDRKIYLEKRVVVMENEYE